MKKSRLCATSDKRVERKKKLDLKLNFKDLYYAHLQFIKKMM